MASTDMSARESRSWHKADVCKSEANASRDNRRQARRCSMFTAAGDFCCCDYQRENRSWLGFETTNVFFCKFLHIWHIFLSCPAFPKAILTRNAWQSPACSPPGTNACKTRITGPKFTRFLSDVEDSSAVPIHVAISHPLWKANAHDEGRVCQCLPVCAKSGYHGNVPWAIVKRISAWPCQAYMYLS